MIKFACPTCGKKFAVPDKLAGRTARCLKCKQIITIHSPAGLAPTPPAQQPAPQREPAPTADSQAPAQETWQPSPADVANALKTRMTAPPIRLGRGGLHTNRRIVAGLLGVVILFAGALMLATTPVSGPTQANKTTEGTLVFIGIALASTLLTLVGYFRALALTGLASLGAIGYLLLTIEAKTGTAGPKGAHFTLDWGVLALGAVTLIIAGALPD